MSDIQQLYKDQRAKAMKARQLMLFAVREDSRPASQRTAAGRYEEPLLFDGRTSCDNAPVAQVGEPRSTKAKRTTPRKSERT